MAWHDNLANKAWLMNKTSADFKRAAQKHANATWFFLIVSAVVWYFSSWPWAIIPGLIAAFTGFQSVSSTMVQSRLEKMGR